MLIFCFVWCQLHRASTQLLSISGSQFWPRTVGHQEPHHCGMDVAQESGRRSCFSRLCGHSQQSFWLGSWQIWKNCGCNCQSTSNTEFSVSCTSTNKKQITSMVIAVQYKFPSCPFLPIKVAQGLQTSDRPLWSTQLSSALQKNSHISVNFLVTLFYGHHWVLWTWNPSPWIGNSTTMGLLTNYPLVNVYWISIWVIFIERVVLYNDHIWTRYRLIFRAW